MQVICDVHLVFDLAGQLVSGVDRHSRLDLSLGVAHALVEDPEEDLRVLLAQQPVVEGFLQQTGRECQSVTFKQDESVNQSLSNKSSKQQTTCL